MSCQHPNCFYPIHSMCTNHCHWSLCEEHINEHRKSLVTEFEELLKNLINPTNELSNLMEARKQSLTIEQHKQLDYLKQSYKKQINKFEQPLIMINRFQEQHNQIYKHLIQIKTNEILLTQNDFQPIDILSKEINQYKDSLKDKEENRVDLQQTQILHKQCPLISLNIYGLLSSHNVRLCSPNRKIEYLFKHLCNYHHLTCHYANELIKAIELNLDPIQTKIFPSNTKITTINDKQPCPLYNAPKESGIRSTPCSTMVTEKFLPVHLQIVHRLRSPQIKELIKKN
ncbi:unnamed protein product [Rotaria sp. Silwood2]|nr:unnamed protein product [Rotaria sp. Silwood2]CAF2511980.1 unnamed protein product [Rotaria sp. Silwood2]CAF2745530.1 unnamed protein product [Rotaria sp. Silwood2]CAF3866821.1 unnamed protein product [Rotaria sp. Silwood2]CAF3902030.1 unnamed protein product [Rotaria sp. Silwood2]